MKLALRFLLFLGFIPGLSAQTLTLSGKITDTLGRPVPFASVYQKNTTKGTSANSDGEYTINLPSGTYDIIYQALNYTQEIRHIDLQKSQVVNVTLGNEIYELQSVSIRSTGEDPAYRIIRNAIKSRKGHLQEVKAYSCDVYIKGLQKLLGAPRKFFGQDIDKIARQEGLDSNRTGIIYLSESESKFTFAAPDKIHEEVVSSKISGNNRSFSFNRATDMKLNFYENFSEWEDLSNRPMVSPISDQALMYYTYKLLGTTEENGETVHKIQVIPKRRSDPVFRGNIYIIEDSWRIHSVGLYLTKEANINFVDTLKINQRFFPVDGKVWMPSAINFDFTGSFLGFRFGGYFTAVYKNYDLNPAQDKKLFSEVLRMTREANKKDSLYWVENRPIPLTPEEARDYEKKASIALKRESKPYLDSLDAVHNKFKLRPFIAGSGYVYRNRYKHQTIQFNSLLNSAFYNTVEGFGLNYMVEYVKKIDTLQNKQITYSGRLRYGFESQKAHLVVHTSMPLNNATISMTLGSDVTDLNNLGSVPMLGNSLNSLLFERNRKKFYEKRFASVTISRRVLGLMGYMNVEWANRKWLPNISNYSFRDDADREFTSNNPFFPSANVQLFPENQSFVISGGLSYEFSKKYATMPTFRYYYPSKYPKLSLNYTKGVKGVFGSDIDYDLVSASVSKAGINLGLYGKTSFYLGAGKFLNNKSLYYIDYKHFAGTQTLVYQPGLNVFLFQDYYKYSTADQYFEAHLEHNFSGFILNKVPLIRKLKLQEIGGANYMTTPALKNYTEFYLGLQYLGFRGVYGQSFVNGKQMNSAFRIKYTTSL